MEVDLLDNDLPPSPSPLAFESQGKHSALSQSGPHLKGAHALMTAPFRQLPENLSAENNEDGSSIDHSICCLNGLAERPDTCALLFECD